VTSVPEFFVIHLASPALRVQLLCMWSFKHSCCRFATGLSVSSAFWSAYLTSSIAGSSASREILADSD
ncbi:MAG: hypothetical protein ACTHOU_14225, partial [Aureliella sp.]